MFCFSDPQSSSITDNDNVSLSREDACVCVCVCVPGSCIFIAHRALCSVGFSEHIQSCPQPSYFSIFSPISWNLWTRSKIDRVEFNLPVACLLLLSWIIKDVCWSGSWVVAEGWGGLAEPAGLRGSHPFQKRRIGLGNSPAPSRSSLWDSGPWILSSHSCVLHGNGWT